jgi:hypothetical protein
VHARYSAEERLQGSEVKMVQHRTETGKEARQRIRRQGKARGESSGGVLETHQNVQSHRLRVDRVAVAQERRCQNMRCWEGSPRAPNALSPRQPRGLAFIVQRVSKSRASDVGTACKGTYRMESTSMPFARNARRTPKGGSRR